MYTHITHNHYYYRILHAVLNTNIYYTIVR